MMRKRTVLMLVLAAFICAVSVAAAGDYVIPAGTTVIEAEAFYGNQMMTAVTLPDGLLTIRSRAFANTGLTEVTLPDSLQSIAEDAFDGCLDMKVSAAEGTAAYVQAVQYGWIVPEKETDDSTRIILPEKLAAGADLTILVDGPSTTLRHTIYLYNPENHWLQSRIINGPSGKVSWPGYALEENVTYRVIVSTITTDTNPQAALVRDVEITGSKPAAPALELPEKVPNWQETRFDVSAHEDVYLHIQYITKDGDAADEWSISTRDVEDGNQIDIGVWFEDLKSLRISWSIYRDGRWSAMSNPVEIPVTEDGGVLESLYELNCPTEVQNGQDMTISFTYSEEVTYYSLSIQKLISDEIDQYSEVYWYSSNNCPGHTELVIPGGCMEEGEYRLELYLDTPSKGGGSVYRIIQATGERSGKAPTIETNRDLLYYNQTAILTINAVNADEAEVAYLRIKNNINGNNGTHYVLVDLDGDGNGSYRYRNDYELYSDGSVTIQASVKNGGRWSPFSDPVTIELKMPEQLDEAEVTVADEYKAGEDVVFSFASVKNAEYYRVYLCGQYSDTTYYSMYSEALPDRELSIPGYAISSGTYRLEVCAYASGYKSSEHTEIIRITGKQPQAPEVIASFDELHIHQNATFVIDSQNADRIRIRYSYTTEDSENGYSIETPTPVGDQTEWELYIREYEGWQLELSFTVQKDGVWSSWKKLTYTILGAPQLAEPVINAETEYEAGKDIVLSFGAVEHATSYEYRLYSNTNGYERNYWTNSSGSVHFSARDLNAGKYVFSVTASGEDYASSTGQVEFSIIGEKESGPDVQVNKTSVWEDENITWAIGTEEADLVYYRVSTPSYSDWTSGSFTPRGATTSYVRSLSDAGVYSYRFTLLKNGKWTEWSAPITVTVKALPILESAEVNVNTAIAAGQDLTFRFDSVSGAESYRVYLENIMSGNTVYSWYESKALPDQDLTAPGYLLTAGTYELKVIASANEAKSSTKTTMITVTGKRPAGPEVTAETTPIRIRSTAAFLIETPNAETVQVKYQYYMDDDSYYGEYMDSLEATSPVTRWEHTVNRYLEGYRLSIGVSAKVNGIWSNWNYAEYTIEGLPPLEEAIIHAEDSYQAGMDITLSFDGVENATRYEYRLYKEESTSSIYSNSSSTAASLFRYGYQLENGTYRFVVTASSDDYVSSTAERTFVIEGERLAAPNVSVSSSDVKEQEYFDFTIDTAGASALRCRVNDGSAYSINVFDDSTVYSTYRYYAGTYSYQFCVQDEDGIWSEWTMGYPVTVTAYDPLDEPEVQAKSEYIFGENISVEISPVTGATGYSVYLYDASGNSITNKSLNQAEGGTVILSGYRIPKGSLTLCVTASNAHVSSSVSLPIKVTTGTRPSAPEVTPPVGTSVSRYSYITFQISTEGATRYAVRYYSVGDTNNPNYSEGNVSEDGISITYQDYIYASSGSRVNFSFATEKEGVWSDWSPAITLTVE